MAEGSFFEDPLETVREGGGSISDAAKTGVDTITGKNKSERGKEDFRQSQIERTKQREGFMDFIVGEGFGELAFDRQGNPILDEQGNQITKGLGGQFGEISSLFEDARGPASTGQAFQEASKGLLSQAQSDDPTQFAERLTAAQRAEEAGRLEQIEGAGATQAASQFGALAQQGGAGPGARERLAAGAGANALRSQQQERRAGALARLGLLSEDEGRKLALEQSLISQGQSAREFDVGQATDFEKFRVGGQAGALGSAINTSISSFGADQLGGLTQDFGDLQSSSTGGKTISPGGSVVRENVLGDGTALTGSDPGGGQGLSLTGGAPQGGGQQGVSLTGGTSSQGGSGVVPGTGGKVFRGFNPGTRPRQVPFSEASGGPAPGGLSLAGGQVGGPSAVPTAADAQRSAFAKTDGSTQQGGGFRGGFMGSAPSAEQLSAFGKKSNRKAGDPTQNNNSRTQAMRSALGGF
jgi:hypothetical protein